MDWGSPALTGMSIWIVGACLGFIALVAIWRSWCGYRYVARGDLFTKAERKFFWVLQRVIGRDRLLFGKVRIADILDAAAGGGKARERTAFRQICAKHVDYVVCSKPDLRILCAVELDDSSHNRRDRQARDRLVDKAFASAGVPLVRIAVSGTYDESEIENALRRAVQG